MTQVVSLRVPDGVIVAADSLATSYQALNLRLGYNGTCPHCHQRVQVPDITAGLRAETDCPECTKSILNPNVAVPQIPLPVSATSYAQKVFPFLDLFAVAQFGATALGARTIHSYAKATTAGPLG